MNRATQIHDVFRGISILMCCLALCTTSFSGGGATDQGMVVVALAGTLASLSTLLALMLDPRVQLNRGWSLLLLAFFTWIGLSLIHEGYRKDGLMWAGLWASILGLAFSMHYLARGKTIWVFLGAFLFSIALALGISYLDWKNIAFPGQNLVIPNPKSPTVTGPFFNSAHFGGYLILCNALLLGVLLFFRFQWFTVPVLALLIYANWIALKTDSSSIPVVLAMLPVMLLMWVFSKNWKVGTGLSVLAIAGGIWGASLFVSPAGQQWFIENQKTIGLNNSWSKFTEGREHVWDYGRRIWKDHPLTGAGIGQFGVLSPKYRRDARLTSASVDRQFVNYAHNDFLQIGSELGWVGVALFAALLIYAVVGGLMRRTPVALMATGASIGYLLSGIYDSHITAIPTTMLAFYALLGLAQGEEKPLIRSEA